MQRRGTGSEGELRRERHARRAPFGFAALAVVAVALIVPACSKVPGVYVVEHDGDPQRPGATAAFDAVTFVDGIWSSKALSTYRSEAKPARDVLAAIVADPAAAGAAFGHQAGTGSPYTFTVSGTGTVVDVDSTSAVGTMSVDLAPADGKVDLRIAIGPALLGTALRDALPFVDFSQFTNQIDFADVATALNAKAKTTVIATVDIGAAKGKQVTFLGSFAGTDLANVIVMPAELSVS